MTMQRKDRYGGTLSKRGSRRRIEVVAWELLAFDCQGGIWEVPRSPDMLSGYKGMCYGGVGILDLVNRFEGNFEVRGDVTKFPKFRGSFFRAATFTIR
jgi:hypothetical protein